MTDAVDQWRNEWKQAWSRFGVDRTVREPDPLTARYFELPDDQLVEAMALPSVFWSDGIDDDAVANWRREFNDDHSSPLEQRPERVCLEALIPAWKSGLSIVVQLPYAGDFAERISRETLVVSSTTRHDRTLYRRALHTPLIG